LSSRVVHFEIPCDNPQKTMDFFSKVFGWTFQHGGLMKRQNPGQPIVNSIDVVNIDDAI
jgi:predicted enzyme related to lactoylglutathione lyase